MFIRPGEIHRPFARMTSAPCGTGVVAAPDGGDAVAFDDHDRVLQRGSALEIDHRCADDGGGA
jgi:hypothetical protein